MFEALLQTMFSSSNTILPAFPAFPTSVIIAKVLYWQVTVLQTVNSHDVEKPMEERQDSATTSSSKQPRSVTFTLPGQ